QGPYQPSQPLLGSGIQGIACPSEFSSDRGQRDDAPRPAGSGHGSCGKPGELYRGDKVDIDQLHDLLERGLAHALAYTDTDIVHQDVGRALLEAKRPVGFLQVLNLLEVLNKAVRLSTLGSQL